MKKNLLTTMVFLCIAAVSAQNKTYKYGLNIGASINHYNGNLGNSFFQPKTTCFAGVQANFGKYLNKSFDLNLGAGIGHYGYCQTPSDVERLAHLELKCPGCTDQLGMGDLRSLMISVNVAAKYKFANGSLLKENAKVAPYLYAGMGFNHLSDNMKKQCVNVGYHFTLNAGAGVRYNITERINIGYNLGIGCFMTKKAYAVYPVNPNEVDDHHEDMERMEKRKDLILQNALILGVNF